MAFVVHGQIFLMPMLGGKANRLTESQGFDHGIAWAPNGQSLVFASDRKGQEDLFLLEADDPETASLIRAHKFKVKQLTFSPEAEVGASFSPDGKRISFLRSGKLWTMHLDGSHQKPVTDEVQVFDYEWSPDSNWLLYALQDGSFASELYMVPADGLKKEVKPTNITRYATYNGGVSWSNQGNKIGFISQRQHNSGMYVLSLQKPSAPGVVEIRNNDIDWDDIHLRVKSPAPITAEEGAISPDGTKVAFRSSGSSGEDLWMANSDGGQMIRLTTGNLRPQHIQWAKKSPDTIYFRDWRGTIRMARASAVGSEPATINFRAKMTVRREEEFKEMFEQSWHALQENFYDPQFHGANWNEIRSKYRPLVQNVALKEDLYALISLMLGELNASHLGISGFFSPPEERTAELGLLLDDTYPGPGLRIAEIIKRGPADKRGLTLKAGEIIKSIDRVNIDSKITLEKLLNDKVGEMVRLEVSSNPGPDWKDAKAWRKVDIQAASREVIQNLMYERWVEHNATRVNELSKGKLGYIHIPSMDEDGLDRFVRALYSDNFDKEAIVLDVRFNGGGFTHDQILNYLGAKEHTIFRQRNGGNGTVLRSFDRKWTKPLVLLINNRSYSDAEIFPSAFRTLGLGKLVGQPTGGHVIGTSSVRLIDGSIFRIPRTGVFTAGGINMEKEGVVPDVIVQPNPDQLAKGQDSQLEKAVDVLQITLAQWKKDHSPMASKSKESKPNLAAGGNSPMPLPSGK